MTGPSTQPALEEDAPRAGGRTMKWLAIVGVSTVSLIILAVMNPPLLFSSTTPAGGDMGAHVLGPAFLRDELLPNGRFQGWSNSWFAGFPIFYFYFPLPSLTIVFLDLFLPYGVAFKLVTIMGLLALAPATYFFVRALGFGRVIATIGAAAGGSFVFMETPTPPIFGATIASTLAGEFSYSWSFALAITYLGLLIRAVKDDTKYLPWAAVALALTALSHVLTTIAIVVASLPVLLWKRGNVLTPMTWGLGFALSAFWALPLVARLGMTTDMNWQPLGKLAELFPFELWPILGLGIVGMVWTLTITPRVVPLALITLIPIPAFFLLEQGSKLWNGRVLPHWYYGMFLFAGLAVGLIVNSLARRLPEVVPVWWLRVAIGLVTVFMVLVPGSGSLSGTFARVALVIGVLLMVATVALNDVPIRVLVPSLAVLAFVGSFSIGTVTDESYVNGWARWNYSGYENKDGWSEYEGVLAAVDALPDGRVQWEANSDLNSYGTPMALMLFPYWSEGSHASMEGLFFESSLTTPFHFLNAAEMSRSPSNPIPGLRYHVFNFDRGVEHMKLFNVAYYVTFTEEARDKALEDADMDQVASSPPFTVFELPESDLVEVVENVPWVFESHGDGVLSSFTGIFSPSDEEEFVDIALDWYEDIEMLDQPIVADGPETWPRVGADLDGDRLPIAQRGDVSEIVLENDRISFRTTAVGVPHLVKVSYFPNWQADGADGPYRATPSLMVVVPTQEEVTLEFAPTWAELGGGGLSVVGLLIVGGIFVGARRNRDDISEVVPT